MNFEDHFSSLAEQYAQYRPGYPDELFAFLAEQAPDRELAWDCGTGNGQAAVGLANYFSRVVATDASADQIVHAFIHPRVEYRVGLAEQVDLPVASCDLVSVAVAVHWFDHERFYAEVRRVLKPGGVIAVWTYHLPHIQPEIDELVARYNGPILAEYWPERIHFLAERYQTLPFPFEELPTPKFTASTEWSLDHLAGFLASWSAGRRYAEVHGRHPMELIWDALAEHWGPRDRVRRIVWPLYLRLGRVKV